jgi:DNA-binding transcriptional regulator YiaG
MQNMFHIVPVASQRPLVKEWRPKAEFARFAINTGGIRGRSNRWDAMAIRNLIKDKLRVTQENFAHIMGVTFAETNRWVNGRATPSKTAQNALSSLEKEYAIAMGRGKTAEEFVFHKLEARRKELRRVKPDWLRITAGSISSIGEACLIMRTCYGMTQEEFSFLLNVCFATINRIENGKSKPNPMLFKELRKLAKGAPDNLVSTLSQR